MGYSIGDEWTSKGWRARGYGVPAWCDFPGCKEEIDRGLGYKCEERFHCEEVVDDDGEVIDEIEVEDEGCGLYFCTKHEGCGEAHLNIDVLPPEHPVWINHILGDPSWEKWRNENPLYVEQYKKELLEQP